MNNLEINKVSYIGDPRDNSVMYVTRKIDELLLNLSKVNNCLVFCESGIIVPDSIKNKGHIFKFHKNPQSPYIKFVSKLKENQNIVYKGRCFNNEYNSVIGENATIGKKYSY